MTFIDLLWFVLGVPLGLFLLPLLARVWTDSGVVMVISMMVGGLLSGLLTLIGSIPLRAWFHNVRHRSRR